MLKIYKDGDSFFLTTDIKNSTSFLEEIALVTAYMAEEYSYDLQFQMAYILPLCYEILLILDGYTKKNKSEVYCSVGSITPHSKLIYETDE